MWCLYKLVCTFFFLPHTFFLNISQFLPLIMPKNKQKNTSVTVGFIIKIFFYWDINTRVFVRALKYKIHCSCVISLIVFTVDFNLYCFSVHTTFLILWTFECNSLRLNSKELEKKTQKKGITIFRQMQRGSKSMLKAPQQRKYLYIRIKKKNS